MEITNVNVKKVEGRGILLAYANVVINDCIILKGIKLLDGRNGLFIAMPDHTTIRRGEIRRYEHYHPLNNDTREVLTNAIIEEYEKVK